MHNVPAADPAHPLRDDPNAATMERMGKLTDEQITGARIDGWSGGTTGIYACYDTGDFTAGAQFVSTIAEAADAADHHPDVLLTYPSVAIRLISHDVGAVTDRDVRLADELNRIATTQGIEAGGDVTDIRRVYDNDGADD